MTGKMSSEELEDGEADRLEGKGLARWLRGTSAVIVWESWLPNKVVLWPCGRTSTRQLWVVVVSLISPPKLAQWSKMASMMLQLSLLVLLLGKASLVSAPAWAVLEVLARCGSEMAGGTSALHQFRPPFAEGEATTKGGIPPNSPSKSAGSTTR